MNHVPHFALGIVGFSQSTAKSSTIIYRNMSAIVLLPITRAGGFGTHFREEKVF